MLEIIKTAIDAVKQLAALQRPTTIAVDYPAHSQFAGQRAGVLVRSEDSDGNTYEYRAAELAPSAPPRRLAPLVVGHQFTALDSMAAYLSRLDSSDWSVYVDAPRFQPAGLRALDEQHPERGGVTGAIARHPAFLRWAQGAGTGSPRDLSHADLADLLVDNQEDLTDGELATVIKQFRAAKTVEYDADLDGAGAIGLRTTWKGNSKAEVHLPREFTAAFPAYSGAWAPGDEPRHVARFRLRLVPPKGDSVVPTFRLLWVNAVDFELEAAEALRVQINLVLASSVPVYLGQPRVDHFVVPTLEAKSLVSPPPQTKARDFVWEGAEPDRST